MIHFLPQPLPAPTIIPGPRPRTDEELPLVCSGPLWRLLVLLWAHCGLRGWAGGAARGGVTRLWLLVRRLILWVGLRRTGILGMWIVLGKLVVCFDLAFCILLRVLVLHTRTRSRSRQLGLSRLSLLRLGLGISSNSSSSVVGMFPLFGSGFSSMWILRE